MGQLQWHLKQRAEGEEITLLDHTLASRQGNFGTLTGSLMLIYCPLHRAEIVRWVAESLRPFSIVEDKGFHCLMKTGRPSYYLPSRWTVSRDVRLVFAQTRNRVAKILMVSPSYHLQSCLIITYQEYKGRLNFTMDAWTAPNHQAFVAFWVHLEHKGAPLAMPLDIQELPTVSRGTYLAQHVSTDMVPVTHRH
jgi:hypothetical protein